MHNAVVITAAGSSSRFNSGSDNNVKKEFCSLGKHSVLYCACQPFTEIQNVSVIAVTYSENNLQKTIDSLENLTQKKQFVFVQGGKTRQESVCKALELLNKTDSSIEYVMIHDGARPFVKKDLIERTLTTAVEKGACAPGLKIRDTLVRVNEQNKMVQTENRDAVLAVQTPQIFVFSRILDAHRKAASERKECTDDTQVYASYYNNVYFVPGDSANKKITFAEDLQ